MPETGMAGLEKRVNLNYWPTAPIKKSSRLGTLEVYYNGEKVDSTPLIAGDEIESAPRGLRRLFDGSL
jgi:hypothetical protein